MTEEEISKMIEGVISWHKKLTPLTDFIYGSELYEEIWALFDDNLKKTSEIIGDKYSWISWFFYENELGKRKFEASPVAEEKTRTIKNVKDLIWLIQESK